MIRWPKPWKLFSPRYSLRTLMLFVTLVAVGLWWGQRAVFFRQMAERHHNEANVYRALKEAHPTMADKCTAIVKYHTGLEAIYLQSVYTPWMIIYEHPYETSVVSEVKLVIDTPSEPTPSLNNSSVKTLQPGLGLEGYCPVTLVQDQRWKKGDPKFEASFEGHKYQFAGAEQLQDFLENPSQFVPACNGNDIVRLVDEQLQSLGQRNFGVQYSGKMYFFDSEKTRAAFEKNPAQYVAQAELGPVSR